MGDTKLWIFIFDTYGCKDMWYESWFKPTFNACKWCHAIHLVKMIHGASLELVHVRKALADTKRALAKLQAEMEGLRDEP
eukprot:45406-Eustigmatos_ZCMA.PRE.1